MILKGNQRGGGRQLARHLLNTDDNEHVHVHDMRGFIAADLPSAFHEAYAVSRGTRAKQFLFSLSLNPPPREMVSTEAFERAIEAIERKLGLENQPRAIVFHEKEGRRHAHAVWSRIDTQHMTAINLPHYKLKLRDVAKSLYVEHGWQMPTGFADSRERDPANFTHAEWQQAKRGGHDPKKLKEMFQDCWAMSDSGKSFANALKARGYILARGDRRGHVAVDYRGEVYAIAKFVGRQTREVRAKLEDAQTLPDIQCAKQDIAGRMTDMLKQHVEDCESRLRTQSASLAFRRREFLQRQRHERAELQKAQHARWMAESQARQERFSKGWRGLWDRITGKHGAVRRQNAREVEQAGYRDRTEKDQLVFCHLDQRRTLHEERKRTRLEHADQVAELHRDIAAYGSMKDAQTRTPDAESAAEPTERTVPQRTRRTRRSKDADRGR